MLIGGSRSCGSTPSQSSDAARLDSIRFPSPSTINAGVGSPPPRRAPRDAPPRPPPQRLPQRLHHLPVVGQLQIRRRKATREQQSIALADRQIELLGQVDEELATRAGPDGAHAAP